MRLELGTCFVAIAGITGCLKPPPRVALGTPPASQTTLAEAAPQSPPVAASTLTTQPVPVDVAIPASEYPQQALAANAEGSVMLKILIDETGRVREAKALRDPGYGFGEAAMRSAIAHFRFSPPRLQGRPIAAWWRWSVTYVLPQQ
jgi:periplasmic protein TonB